MNKEIFNNIDQSGYSLEILFDDFYPTFHLVVYLLGDFSDIQRGPGIFSDHVAFAYSGDKTLPGSVKELLEEVGDSSVRKILHGLGECVETRQLNSQEFKEVNSLYGDLYNFLSTSNLS